MRIGLFCYANRSLLTRCAYRQINEQVAFVSSRLANGSKGGLAVCHSQQSTGLFCSSQLSTGLFCHRDRDRSLLTRAHASGNNARSQRAANVLPSPVRGHHGGVWGTRCRPRLSAGRQRGGPKKHSPACFLLRLQSRGGIRALLNHFTHEPCRARGFRGCETLVWRAHARKWRERVGADQLECSAGGMSRGRGGGA